MAAREFVTKRACVVGATLLPALTVLAACCMWQKVELRPAPGTGARTELGEVRMDEPSSRILAVTEHRAHRDSQGRLAVHVEFQNTSDVLYPARVRAEFVDAQGMLEKGAFDVDLRQFLPGTTSMEWTSSTPDAVRYTVELWSGSSLPW
jgi:hypothetical protein